MSKRVTSSRLCPKNVGDFVLERDVDKPFRGALDVPFLAGEWPFGESECPLRCFVAWAVPFDECREPFAVDDSGSRRIALINLRRLRNGGPLCRDLEVPTPLGISGLSWFSISIPQSTLGLWGLLPECRLSSETLRRRLRELVCKFGCGVFARLSSSTGSDGVLESVWPGWWRVSRLGFAVSAEGSGDVEGSGEVGRAGLSEVVGVWWVWGASSARTKIAGMPLMLARCSV